MLSRRTPGNFERSSYKRFFRSIHGSDPYEYQIETAEALVEAKNLVLRAPTGAGKTLAVMTPFLWPDWEHAPARLIYALPLRTLAQGIFREAKELLARVGTDGQATLQTGESPNDPFFALGKIVVTTYDQVLSGLLCRPYGLAAKLHNINAGAVVGALVVFDEFHLMEGERAFLTAVGGMHWFYELSQSVWMTATATAPLVDVIQDALTAAVIPRTAAELAKMCDNIPSVQRVNRSLLVEEQSLSPEAVLAHGPVSSIVLLNTVRRAQEFYCRLRTILEKCNPERDVILLHSRFLKEDRKSKEELLSGLFGKGSSSSAILIATQVVEAGLDLSCQHLHTELCPMNALAQRAGRCARFPGETGVVHVYPLPLGERTWLPYGDAKAESPALSKTRSLLEDIRAQTPVLLTPALVADWVQRVHGDEDQRSVQNRWPQRFEQCVRTVHQNAIQRDPAGVAHLIRGDDDNVRVILATERNRPELAGQREGISLSRGALMRVAGKQGAGWYWDFEQGWQALETRGQIACTYALCLCPSVAEYTPEIGLRLGLAGSIESPPRQLPARPGYAPLHAELWTDHSQRVAEEVDARLTAERFAEAAAPGFASRFQVSPAAMRQAAHACGLLHDLGKLQGGWQQWARAVQAVVRAPKSGALAHTDSGPEVSSIRPCRPLHAACSAFYSGLFLGHLLEAAGREQKAILASACAAAILAHHGGWLGNRHDLTIQVLEPDATGAIRQLLGYRPDWSAIQRLARTTDKVGALEKLLNVTTSADNLREWWPLVCYLTRLLRLSDQRATEEANRDG